MTEVFNSCIGEALRFKCPICGGSKLMYRAYVEETGEVDGVTNTEGKVEVHHGKVENQKEHKVEYFCSSCDNTMPSIKEMLSNKILF
jgi:predicted RNA-binding Zn-ribbon protein involved in translation (DUF1610 family)